MRSVCFHKPVNWRSRQARPGRMKKDNCVRASPVCSPLRMRSSLNGIKLQRGSSSSGNVLPDRRLRLSLGEDREFVLVSAPAEVLFVLKKEKKNK